MRCVVLLCLAGCFAKPDPPSGTGTPDAQVDATPAEIALVAAGSFAALGTVSNVMLNPPPPASSTIVIAVGTYDLGTAAITDTAGNAYQQVANMTTPAGARIALFYSLNAMTSSPFVVAATASSGNVFEVTLAVHAYTGIDRQAGFGGSTIEAGVSASPDSGPIAVSAGALLFGIVSHDAAVTTTVGDGFTLQQVPTEDPARVPMATEDRIVASDGMANVRFNLSGNSGWGCGAMVFIPAP